MRSPAVRGPSTVPDSRFSSTEGSVTEVCRAECSLQWVGVGDETAVLCHLAGSMSRHVDKGGDLELDPLPHWKPVWHWFQVAAVICNLPGKLKKSRADGSSSV